MPLLPFSPKRRKGLPNLCYGLSLTLIVILAFATWTWPPKHADLWPFTGIWLTVGALIFALWVIARAKLTFRADGFERISGLSRQFVFYDAISRIELKRQQGRFGPVQILEVRFNRKVPIIEIWRDDYETGEIEKIAEILREHLMGTDY